MFFVTAKWCFNLCTYLRPIVWNFHTSSFWICVTKITLHQIFNFELHAIHIMLLTIPVIKMTFLNCWVQIKGFLCFEHFTALFNHFWVQEFELNKGLSDFFILYRKISILMSNIFYHSADISLFQLRPLKFIIAEGQRQITQETDLCIRCDLAVSTAWSCTS